jgi:hemerythrin-like domain-containing protein
MNHPIETLKQEHRVIERGLDSLDELCRSLTTSDPENRARLGELARFFREYADRLHHAKEEDMLFSAMADHGFSQDSGPVFVMLAEHDIGRRHVRHLREIAGGEGPLTRDEIDRIQENATNFTALLRGHIQKEDTVLYPAAVQVLPEAVLSELASSFVEFDRSAETDDLRALVENQR